MRFVQAVGLRTLGGRTKVNLQVGLILLEVLWIKLMKSYETNGTDMVQPLSAKLIRVTDRVEMDIARSYCCRSLTFLKFLQDS